ncbi:sphingosine phosphate lyase [Schistosoma japonicum]|uniref:Sphingosine phosphate lyase n=1 Tax=Schistosoma japonicum TaxID=6182 RepID=A0A4Z2DT12_SCHJA|nr:sphingosine phosphate lyase [Schistosoma japonicum]
MSLPRSQAITLKEFLSLHPSDASTISTQSILHNDKQTEQSLNNHQTPLWSQNLIQSINQYLLPNVEHTPSTSTLQSQNKPTFVNNNSSINHSYNKERMYSIPHEITNSSIKPTISNYTNRQQLKRSNTVGITDVTKTMQRKLLMNYATNKVNDHIPIDELLCTPRQYNQLSTQLTNLINSSNDTTYNELSDISHKQRFFSRAQSEHPIRSNNNNKNCPLYSRNNTSSTFRSVFSQRGLNLGKSIWQKNFISDQYEPKTTLGSSDNSQMSTTSYLSQRDRLRKESTVDDALIMDIKGLHSIKNNSSISNICSSSSGNNNSHYINGSLIQSSISSELPPSGLSLVTSMTTTATTTTTISSTTVLSTGTNFNLNRLSTDQSVVKDLWNRKYVEEFLKKSLSTTSTNKLLNIHNEPVHLSSSFSGQTLVQWFCRQIIQSGCSWSHGLISVVCQLCNCLLQLGVLKRDPKSKVINSTTTDKRLFGHYSSDSDGKLFKYCFVYRDIRA